jgi:hypothetical protein
MMLLSKWKAAAAAALAAGLVITGAGVLAQQAPAPNAEPDRLGQLERKIDRLLEALEGRPHIAPVPTEGRRLAVVPAPVPALAPAPEAAPPLESRPTTARATLAYVPQDRLAELERRLTEVEKRLKALEEPAQQKQPLTQPATGLIQPGQPVPVP